jgi:hypothetical protein
MRKYTVVFMEQRLGINRLMPISGPEGQASFEAVDDDQALAFVAEHLTHRVSTCARAELSSMAMVPTHGGGVRLVDDSLENPHFHEFYIKYDPRTQKLEVDFESTLTGLIPASRTARR